MAKKAKVTFETVRKIGVTFPDVEASEGALRVKGSLMACIPSHKSAEPDSLAIRIDPEERAALLAEAPDVYYAPEHYLDYPMMLVRLAKIDDGVVRDLLGLAHKYVLTHPKHKRTFKKKSAR